MGTFSESVRANIKTMLAEIDSYCYKISYDLFMRIVDHSPNQPGAIFSKGEFINNWMVGSNSFTSGTTPIFDSNGRDSRSQIVFAKESKTFLGKDGFLTFSNNVSYAYQVEVLGWRHTTAYAPVQLAFIDIRQQYKL